MDLKPLDPSKLGKKKNENVTSANEEDIIIIQHNDSVQKKSKLKDFDGFSLAKATGLIQNIKSLHNTDNHLLKKGITVYRDGRNYDLNDVNTIDVNIHLLASNLSKLCRYSGNTSKFYSVAEHSIEVSKALLLNYGNVKLALAGLIHDGSEAFLNDMLYTVKQEIGKDSVYIKFEKAIEEHIFKEYGVIEYLDSPIIKHIDVQTCNIEMETLLSNKLSIKLNRNGRLDVKTMTPEEAEESFLFQYHLLKHLIDTYDDKECLCEIGIHKPKKMTL